MASWNSRADWVQAGWVAAVASAYLLASAAALFGGGEVGLYAQNVLRWKAPRPAFDLPFDVGWVWELALALAGVFGPLVALVTAAVRGWPWWRAAVVPAAVGLVAAAGTLLATPMTARFVQSVILAHLGLFAGVAGGLLAWVRARAERPLDADAAVGDDDS